MTSLQDARAAAIRLALTRSDWHGQPWACPQCALYLIRTLDGQHWGCVSGDPHGFYVIHHGERSEVRVEPQPSLTSTGD